MSSLTSCDAAYTSRRRRTRPDEDGGDADGNGDVPPKPLVPDVHPALIGVLGELPRQGSGWTRDRRQAFMTTFEAVVNFTIPIVDDDEDDDEPED